jgi:hypothetical protein
VQKSALFANAATAGYLIPQHDSISWLRPYNSSFALAASASCFSNSIFRLSSFLLLILLHVTACSLELSSFQFSITRVVPSVLIITGPKRSNEMVSPSLILGKLESGEDSGSRGISLAVDSGGPDCVWSSLFTPDRCCGCVGAAKAASWAEVPVLELMFNKSAKKNSK